MTRLKTDRDYYAKTCLKIRDKQANIIPLKYNAAQLKLVKIIEDWEKSEPNTSKRPTLYIIILKARQLGFSTATEAMFFQDLNFNSNMVAMIVSYDDDSAVNINDMSNRYYQYLPQVLKPQIRPARGKGLFFENPRFRPDLPEAPDNQPGLQSKFWIETARNINAGSSFTIHRLHISELAKWPSPEETMTSLMQAVPPYGAIVIVESTAKGIEYFYDLWQAATEGKNQYVPLFVNWLGHPEYNAKPSAKLLEDIKNGNLSEREKYIMKNFPEATPEKMQWRRNTIANKLNGSVDMFKQEYPTEPDDAFLTTGTPVFNLQKVKERKQQLEKAQRPFETYRITSDITPAGDPIKRTTRLIKDNLGPLRIYKMPVPGTPYVIGGDIAEGGADNATMQVLDNITGEQVAVWGAQRDTDEYAKQMYLLGHLYNEALLAVEVNFDTHPVKELARLGYNKQYRREVPDDISTKHQHKYGFKTTSATRPPIIDTLVSLVKETPELLNDIPTLDEMLYFIRNPARNWRPEAQQGKHDDYIMALAIAYHARAQQRMWTEAAVINYMTNVDIPPDLRKDLEEDPEALTHFLHELMEKGLISNVEEGEKIYG